MNTSSLFAKTFKILFLFILAGLFFTACENHRFDSDKRQIMAKDEIRGMLHQIHGYDITGFKEDTVITADDPDFKKKISYTLNIEYIDSNNVLQKKEGIVFFTIEGFSIINSKITDR